MDEIRKAALKVAADDFLNAIFSVQRFCYNTNFVVDNLLTNTPDYDLVMALKKSFEEGTYENYSWDDARNALLRHYDYISGAEADAIIRKLKRLSIDKKLDDAFRLTDEGKKAIAEFIERCRERRKKILDKGEDTANFVNLPTEDVILSDVNRTGVDEFGFYMNVFAITDHYNSKGLSLCYWRDFI